AGGVTTVADENHVAGAGLKHECKILPGHDRGRVGGDLGGARDFARNLHRELGLAHMVHGDGIVATVLDTSRCAVGGRDAVRHLAHPTLQQIADLRVKRSTVPLSSAVCGMTLAAVPPRMAPTVTTPAFKGSRLRATMDCSARRMLALTTNVSTPLCGSAAWLPLPSTWIANTSADASCPPLP